MERQPEDLRRQPDLDRTPPNRFLAPSGPGLKKGWFSIDISDRKATLYDNGTNPIVTASVPQLGEAVAKLLSLPVHSSSPSSPSLSDYKNRFVYIRSFSVSQVDMLAAIQHATHSNPEEWTVEKMSIDDYINAGRKLVAKGDQMGAMKILHGSTFKKGLGDQFHGRELANEKIGLDDENLDEVITRVVMEVLVDESVTMVVRTLKRKWEASSPTLTMA